MPNGQRRRRALKINKHTRNELKIEAGDSQRALAGVKGITKLKCHISVKHKMQVRGEREPVSDCVFLLGLTERECVEYQIPALEGKRKPVKVI